MFRALMSVQQTGWSPDGSWFWDGARWNDSISEDGQWRFDGMSWQPFQGQRTAMPVQPFNPPPAALVPPSPLPIGAAAPGADPLAAMPSWVAPSEIERLQQEKIEQQMAAVAPPAPPPPPDRDWRRVGEFMKYSKSSGPAFWRVGWTSVGIYVLLLWLCSPVALVYVWLTGWRTYTKIYRTAIALFFVSALVRYITGHYTA
jgi:hypothetical protein